MKSQLINSSFEIKEGDHRHFNGGCNSGMSDAPDSFIIYNNKKGLLKVVRSRFGIGYVKIPLQEPKVNNSDLWAFLEIGEVK